MYVGDSCALSILNLNELYGPCHVATADAICLLMSQGTINHVGEGNLEKVVTYLRRM